MVISNLKVWIEYNKNNKVDSMNIRWIYINILQPCGDE